MDNHVQSKNLNEQSSEVGVDVNNLDTFDNTKAKLTDWEKEPTIVELKADLEFARQETNDQVTNVNGWLDLRNATGSEAPKKSKSGRSAVQPKTVRKNNEWRYPALSEPFLDTDRMFTVKPRTGGDQAKAKQNELVLNWQFDTKIDKQSFIDKYVRKAVDEGSVVVRVGWEKEFKYKTIHVPVYEYYPVMDDNKVQMIQQAVLYHQMNDPHWESLPETLKASAEKSIELGSLVEAEKVGEEKTRKKVMVKNCPSLRIIKVDNLFVDPSCEGEWEKAQFMVYTYSATEAELRAKSKQFKNLNDVKWESAKIQSQHGNPDHNSDVPNTDTRTNSDKQKVLVYEYWGLYDIFDNGIHLPIVVTWVGDTIIQMAENPFPDGLPPFVLVPYMPITDSVFGEADASLLQDNQRIIGAVTRGMIDLLGRSANAQTGYAKGFLDSVNKRRFTQGDDFEFNPTAPPEQSIRQMTYPEIPRSALETINIQNAEAEGLTGVKAFSGGISGDAYGSVATGIRGALDSAATREMSILRRLAQGMKKIGEKIICMNAKFLSEKEIIRVTDSEFVEVSRKELEGNYDLKVDISTASVDEQKAMDLGMILQTVGPDMDPGLRSIILADIADLKRMPALAERIRNYQPQPDPLQQALQEAELQKLQTEIALNQAKEEETKAKAAQIIEDIDEVASGLRHERDVEKMGAQAEGNRNLEVTKAMLKGETPSPLLEATVGFNEFVDQKGKRDTAPKLGSGYSDPTMVPEDLSGQMLPIGPLSNQ